MAYAVARQKCPAVWHQALSKRKAYVELAAKCTLELHVLVRWDESQAKNCLE